MDCASCQAAGAIDLNEDIPQTSLSASGLARHATGRRREVLIEAAQIFAEKGYKATSMRDIGRATGLLGGSLYHHIRSKDDLFVELHNAALDAAEERIAAAVSSATEPWDRLDKACTCLLQIQLDPQSIALPIMNDYRSVPDDVQKRMLARRDAFEGQFRDLVDALPLPAEFDRSIFRNFLLSAMNTAPSWVRPGRFSPAEIAQQLLYIFRH